MISPIEISLMAGVALLLFGAERLPKIARSAGEMRREFMRGQTEGEAPVTPAAPGAPVAEPTQDADHKDPEHHPA